ncbi:MAG: hypothetical protein HUU35_19830 [Armatimonadetes bacterium]|nr:hypothetical protein [Armatimonadota bacterium]
MQPFEAALRAATFFVAIFAALVSLQLYNLIRTGELAQTWRSFIIGALVFAVWALTNFANTFFGDLFTEGGRLLLVMDLLQMVFVLLLAHGLWRQRQLFYQPGRYRPPQPGPDGVEVDHDDSEEDEPPVTVV